MLNFSYFKAWQAVFTFRGQHYLLTLVRHHFSKKKKKKKRKEKKKKKPWKKVLKKILVSLVIRFVCYITEIVSRPF